MFIQRDPTLKKSIGAYNDLNHHGAVSALENTEGGIDELRN